MPYPVIESITETTNIAPADVTLDITLDNADSADDLLLLFITSHVSVEMSMSGWTELWDDNTSQTNTGGAAFYKKATGSEGASVVVTAASLPAAFAAQVYRISNWDIAQNPEARAIQNLASTATPDPSAFESHSWGADDNLFINVLHYADDRETVSSWPDNFVDGTLDTIADGGTDESAQLASCYDFDNVTTAANPNNYTLTTIYGSGEACLSSTIAVLGGAGSAPEEQLSMGGVIVHP